MLDAIEIIFITLMPLLELRAGIPYGILAKGMDAWLVFIICTITNIALAPLVYLFIDKVVHRFFFIKPFHRFYHRNVEKAQKKMHKFVEKYGEWGIAVFIAIPLPGSGVYTAALGSYLLGLELRKFMIASVIGVIIAGAIVTAVTLAGVNGFGIFVKMI